jgi:aminopeptidase N
MKKALLPALLFLVLAFQTVAQPDFYKSYTFTQADTLRGALRPERTCFDVTFYDLNIGVDIAKQFIKGFVDVHFTVLEPCSTIQLDLFKNMKINEITFYDQPLTFVRQHDAVFVRLPFTMPKGTKENLRVAYEGFPVSAQNPPWEGGFVWSKDQKGNPWVGVACEGDGASLWWPCKDHPADEPDSIIIRVAVPDGLACISNGNLRKTKRLDNGYTQFDWFVSYPINLYNVSLNIGKYSHFSDVWTAAGGDTLALDYYVLTYNLEKAKKHFEQVKPMLTCYERYFDKYPFWRDGFAMVETPYLGMEHQSGIAYGNNYNRGYLGGMIPRDMNWDFIIIHESGHEWFGNAVSSKDHCDMWIHESFTTYMEALYVECTMSYADAVRYLESQRSFIRNLEPLVGPPNVNWDDWQASDHYFKGSWILHTLRSALDNDEQWFALLKALYKKFAFTTTSTDDLVQFINTFTGKDFSRFFDQYLRHTNIPSFAYQLTQMGNDLKVVCKWEADDPGFDMPVKVGKKGAYQMIYPTTEIQEFLLPNLLKSDFEVATELFYIKKKGL